MGLCYLIATHCTSSKLQYELEIFIEWGVDSRYQIYPLLFFDVCVRVCLIVQGSGWLVNGPATLNNNSQR